MTRRAAEVAGLEGLNEFLLDQTQLHFLTEDVVAPAKIINDFAKKNEKLEIKAGVIEGTIASAEDIKALAELPSREGLFLCFSAYFKLQCATSHLQQKLLQNKKKSKARNSLHGLTV